MFLDNSLPIKYFRGQINKDWTVISGTYGLSASDQNQRFKIKIKSSLNMSATITYINGSWIKLDGMFDML